MHLRTLRCAGLVAALVAAPVLLGGCVSSSSRPDSGDPAAANGLPAIGPGMNASGEVVDSSKVQSGYGRKVKGLDNWQGEITGKASPDSKFKNLEIGMSMAQVMDIAGTPNDQGAYMTGKAFIPVFFGADRHRHEFVYKNQGRLIFASGSMRDVGMGYLIWIIHNPTEGGTR